MSERSLYLIDGMALAYRAYFALIRSPISTSKGFNTSAIFGFTSTLIELIASRQPSHLVIVFDTDAPTHRHTLFPDYKANREAMPEDLSTAMPHLSRIAEAFDIPVLRMDGFEADDIIGTLAKQAEAAGFEAVYMVTPDKDFGQLVTPTIRMYRPSRKGDTPEVLDPAAVCEKWDVQSVDQVIDMLGLCGDSSDNIPGVPGIGPKTASKLLHEYTTIENLLANVDTLKGKIRERLSEHREQALLSKTLATIDTAVPITPEWESYRISAPLPEKVLPLFAEFEFRTLGKRLFGEAAAPTEPDLFNPLPPAQATGAGEQATLFDDLPEPKTLADEPHDYQLVSDTEAIPAITAELRAAGGFAFDTETTGLNPRRARLHGIALAHPEKNRGWYIELPESSAEARLFFDALQALFGDPELLKTGHNLKFDLSMLFGIGMKVSGPLFDTMIAHALVSPGQRHSLDRLAEDLLDYRTIPFNAVFPEANPDGEISYAEVDRKQLCEYAVEDAVVANRLRLKLHPQLEELNQAEIARRIEAPLIPVLARMEQRGVRVDASVLGEISRSMEATIGSLEGRCYELAGESFNLNSPKQLGEILFDKLKIAAKPKKTRTGQYATNEQTLATLANAHPLVDTILEYRGLVKLKNTYLDALPTSIEPGTGRIHTHFGQAQTATGRLSSNSPNLQNIPIRSAEGREIRRAFVAEAGWQIASADYSQIELRILAALSRDADMLLAFAEGKDIHAATAAKIYGVSEADVTREQRSKAKMVNFGIPYGISAFGLAQRLRVSRTEAQELIDNYFSQFPGVRGYIDETLFQAKERGYVETLSGRRRYLEDIRSANATMRAGAERNAINMPIQGTAADMIKLAMIRVDAELTQAGLASRLILQVHDELVLEVAPGELEAVTPLVRDAMVNALPIDCPLAVELGSGNNWLEAH